MRVHVLCARPRQDAAALAAALRDAGQDVTLVTAPAAVRAAAVRAVLAARAIDEDAATLPFTRRALRGTDGVAHAFTLADAYAAAREGRPLVVSLTAPVARESLAARRLRLTWLKAVLQAAGAVTAPDATIAAGAERWLGVRPRILDPAHDTDACIALYDEVRSRP